MKRSISLLLVSVMMLSLMSGCGKTETPPQVVPTKPVDVQIGDVDKPEVEKDVAIYSDKNVLKVLKDKGFEDVNNYTIYPTDEYYIPTYLSVDGKLQKVYVGLEDHRNRNYYEEDMLEMTFSSVQGDAMSSWKSAVTNSITSFIGGGSSSNDIAAAQGSFVVREAELGYYEPGISYYPPFNTSEFKNVKDSSYLSVITSPLSTFAADVDTASYTNFRSILVDRLSYESLYLTDDLHDIRIEEMLNYFKYDLGNKVETSDGKFTISSEIGQTPWNKDTNLMVVNIKADELDKEEYSGSNLVFLIDTSGSMSNKQISECYSEIYGAIQQFGGKLQGKLGFFDAVVVDPIPFEDEEEFKIIRPKGGGGTSFDIIFDYVEKEMEDEPPVSIVILTDGYAPFPKEACANGIPVLWIINNKEVTPPWGKIARILENAPK